MLPTADPRFAIQTADRLDRCFPVSLAQFRVDPHCRGDDGMANFLRTDAPDLDGVHIPYN